MADLRGVGAAHARVSIHAPARGATRIYPMVISGEDTFRSTLPRGERLRMMQRNHRQANVSIHAPARGATAKHQTSHAHSIVSIHAPAKGATCQPSQRAGCGDVSIHAPARGATRAMLAAIDGKEFRSTLPRGERRFSWSFPTDPSDRFDPRSREGSDHPGAERHQGVRVSIHAPARGAIGLRSINANVVHVSIHAPARGATRWNAF